MAIAAILDRHPRVERVYYPGLTASPDHSLALSLFPAHTFGGVLAFGLKERRRDRAMQFLEALRLVRPAPSIGDCMSLILYPAMASHRGLSSSQREALGIHDGILRLSVGIEDASDIIADLENALNQSDPESGAG